MSFRDFGIFVQRNLQIIVKIYRWLDRSSSRIFTKLFKEYVFKESKIYSLIQQRYSSQKCLDLKNFCLVNLLDVF